jgi:hypothetical protein
MSDWVLVAQGGWGPFETATQPLSSSDLLR